MAEFLDYRLNNRIQAAAISTTTRLEFSIWHNYDQAVYLLWPKGSTRYTIGYSALHGLKGCMLHLIEHKKHFVDNE